jgi:hypothetical protein
MQGLWRGCGKSGLPWINHGASSEMRCTYKGWLVDKLLWWKGNAVQVAAAKAGPLVWLRTLPLALLGY